MKGKKAIRVLESIDYYLKTHTNESCEEEHMALALAIKALEKENKYDMAIKAIHDIKEKIWEIDIPSPTIPEYIEHHEQVKSVLKVIYNWLTKLEEEEE